MVGSDENLNNTGKLIILDCPLCGQGFKTSETRYSHLKNCSNKLNLSTAQLIKAVRLQEKHVNERLAAGLPSFTDSRLSKIKESKKQSIVQRKPKSKAEEDFQLGLALSASLKETENEEIESSNELSKSLFLCKPNEQNKTDIDKTDEKFHEMKIESFNFKTKKKEKKIKSFDIPVLLLRSEEERIKLLQERISSHFISESIESSVMVKKEFDKDIPSDLFKSRRISKLIIEKSPLWKISNEETNILEKFYVPSLKSIISPRKSMIKSQEHKLLQSEIIPFSKFSGVLSETFKYDNETNLHSMAALKLASSLKILVSNEDGSDVRIIVAENRSIPAHSIILKVRCPNIIKDFSHSWNVCEKNIEINWSEVSYESALAFLEVIYTGYTNIYLDKTRDLKTLIYRYKVQNLFENLNVRMQLDVNQSMIYKEQQQLQNILNSILKYNVRSENCFDEFRVNKNDTDDKQDDEMEDVYQYLSQKQEISDSYCKSLHDLKFGMPTTNNKQSQLYHSKENKDYVNLAELDNKTYVKTSNKITLDEKSLIEEITNDMSKNNYNICKSDNKLKDLNEILSSSSSSQSSSYSDGSTMLDDLIIEEDFHYFKESENNSKLKNYIQCNQKFYQDVLEYKPFPVSEFHKKIKSAGIKISLEYLMNFLDEECIVFTLPQGEKSKVKQQQRSKKYKNRVKGKLAKKNFNT